MSIWKCNAVGHITTGRPMGILPVLAEAYRNEHGYLLLQVTRSVFVGL